MHQPTIFTTTQPTIDGKPPPTYEEHTKHRANWIKHPRGPLRASTSTTSGRDQPNQATHHPDGTPMTQDPMDQEQWNHFNHAMEACRQEQQHPSPIPIHHQPPISRAPGFTGAQREMANLLEWHNRSGHSQYDWERDQEDHDRDMEANPREPPDVPPLATTPLKHRPTYEKRRPHYEE